MAGYRSLTPFDVLSFKGTRRRLPKSNFILGGKGSVKFTTTHGWGIPATTWTERGNVRRAGLLPPGTVPVKAPPPGSTPQAAKPSATTGTAPAASPKPPAPSVPATPGTEKNPLFVKFPTTTTTTPAQQIRVEQKTPDQVVRGRGESITVSSTVVLLASENKNRAGIVLRNESLAADVRIGLGDAGKNIDATHGFLLPAGEAERWTGVRDFSTEGSKDSMFYGAIYAIRTGSTDAAISVMEW